MTRFFAGLKDGSPVVKIMADNADDPLTTPNTDYEKFRFNSENSAYCYLDDIVVFAEADAVAYWPAGTDSSDYLIKKEDDQVWCHYARLVSWYGFVPIILLREAEPNSGGGVMIYETLSSGIFGMVGRLSLARYKATGALTFAGNLALADGVHLMPPFPTEGRDFVLFVTRFPATHDYSEPTGSETDVSFFVADNVDQIVRIAKPGFNARTAAPSELIVSEDQTPLAVIDYGTVEAVASSTVEVDLPAFVADESFVLLQPYLYATDRVAAINLPNPALFGAGAVYVKAWVEAGKIKVQNTSPNDAWFQWTVFARDPLPPSGGSGRVWYVDDGKFVFVRPGADDPPRLADILLSEKLRYPPLIANGKVTVTTSTTSHVVNLPELDNPPIILTSMKKVDGTTNMNGGDVGVDVYVNGGFFFTGFPYYLNNYWIWDKAAQTVTWAITPPDAGTAELRYYVLACPN